MLALKLEALGYEAFRDFVLSDRQDGVGPVIGTWTHVDPRPTQAQLDAVTQAVIDAARRQKIYSQAKILLTADDHISTKEKAVLLVIMDEFNAHANKINAVLTAIDGAASFAAMKTAIAAIADYPQRTASQIKTSVSNKIDAGLADG